MKVIMRCGHVALGRDIREGTPACPICLGLTEEALLVMIPQPDLRGRTAKCVVCEDQQPSSLDLPYFQYREGGDEYYCGCREALE
jgi:hypothetical protein